MHVLSLAINKILSQNIRLRMGNKKYDFTLNAAVFIMYSLLRKIGSVICELL